MNDFEGRVRDFARDVQQEVFAQADASEDGALRAHAFAEVMLARLAEAGAIDDGIPASFEGRNMRCSGFFLPDDHDRLDLFLCIPRLDGEGGTITRTDVVTAFRRLKGFFQKALGGLHRSLGRPRAGYRRRGLQQHP